MAIQISGQGYKDIWGNITVNHYEGYYPNMSDYHIHEFYEISLIFSGDVNILLSDTSQRSTDPKIVLLRPFTSHYIYCEPQILYKRVNLLFSKDFIEDFITEYSALLSVFKPNGAIHKLNTEECEKYKKIILKIEAEESELRKKFLTLYLLSLIADNTKKSDPLSPMPEYITNTLSYINEHYSEKIISGEIAAKFKIGRTTLMTSFKKFTGTTINEYLTKFRLKKAIILLKDGASLQNCAELCGFGDSSNLIRCFKRYFNTTPTKYLSKK